MTTLETAATAPPVPSPSVRQLARLEARRFARSPVFLTGVVLLAVTTAAAADDRSEDVLGNGVFAAFFLGIFSFVAAHRLTRSTRPAQEAIDAAPVDQSARTAALLLACLVPAAVGVLWLAAMLVTLEVWTPQDWKLAGSGPGDRLAVYTAHSVVAALGASMLGVATGRWLRFPGAAVVGVVALIGWSMAGIATGQAEQHATWAEVVRLTAPFGFFYEVELDKTGVVAWTGSAAWHLAYLLVLCGFAALAALLRGAGAPLRRTVLRVGAAGAVLAVALVALAVTGGPDQPVVHRSDGTTAVVEG